MASFLDFCDMASLLSTLSQSKGFVIKLVMAAVLLLHLASRVLVTPSGMDDCLSGGSRHCTELKLFRDWEYIASPSEDAVANSSSWANGTSVAAAPLGGAVGFGLSFRNGLRPLRISAEVQPDGGIATQALGGRHPEPWDLLHRKRREAEDLLQRRRNGTEVDAEPLLRQLRPATEVEAEPLLRLYPAAGDEGNAHESGTAVEAAKDRIVLYEAFDREGDRITKSLSERGSLTPWGRQLEDLQHDFDAKWGDFHSRHKKHEVTTTTTPPVAAADSVASPVLQEINDLLRQMCEEPKHRDLHACKPVLAALPVAHEQTASPEERRRELDEELKTLAKDHAVWQHDFDDKVSAVHRELCEDPSRHDRPDCIKFLASIAENESGKHRELHDAHQASLAVMRSSVAQEVRERAAALERRLSEIVAERRAWEAELLKKYGIGEHLRRHHAHQSHKEPEAAAAAEADALHWAPVEAWPLNNRLRGASQRRGNHTVLHRRELLGPQWAGKIPKVAAITPFKSSLAARIQLKYFIENFRMQHYEGVSQLVLVYHKNDREAAGLAALYADGASVKAVAAQGEEQDFPSTTDLRFGAWSAKDADVIAHWPFNEWHHPSRLSLQVRAMAFSARPACVFKAATNDTADLAASDASLVGDAAWMREHWHPWMQEQTVVLHSAQAFHIVELDMK